MMASPEHATRQAKAHLRLPNYGVHGYRWAADALRLTKPGQSILDYGCGKGTFAKAMAGEGRVIREYDPGIPGKDSMPEPADLVICTDVLPFVERDRLAETVAHIESLALSALFVAIPYHPGFKLAAYPDVPHIIMKPIEWADLFDEKPVTWRMGGKGTPYLLIEWQG